MGHTVQYGVVGGGGMKTRRVAGSETLAQLSGLVPSTEYWIQVAAVNSVETGEFSSSITQETEGKYNIHQHCRLVTVTPSTPTEVVLYPLPYIVT